jgi:hypothetical protein
VHDVQVELAVIGAELATWGVQSRFGTSAASSGWSDDGGSISSTSIAATAIVLLHSAFASATGSTKAPRPVFISTAVETNMVPTAGFEPGDLMITIHPLFQLS